MVVYWPSGKGVVILEFKRLSKTVCDMIFDARLRVFVYFRVSKVLLFLHPWMPFNN